MQVLLCGLDLCPFTQATSVLPLSSLKNQNNNASMKYIYFWIITELHVSECKQTPPFTATRSYTGMGFLNLYCLKIWQTGSDHTHSDKNAFCPAGAIPPTEFWNLWLLTGETFFTISHSLSCAWPHCYSFRKEMWIRSALEIPVLLSIHTIVPLKERPATYIYVSLGLWFGMHPRAWGFVG